MGRALKPRAAVALAASFVSQLTCLVLLGIDPRRYLDVLVPRCRGVVHVGRLRLVPLDVAVEALRGLAADVDTEGADNANAASERQPESAAEVLGALGYEVVR